MLSVLYFTSLHDNLRTNPYYARLQSEVLEQITTHFNLNGNYSSSGVDLYLSGHRYMYNDNRIGRIRNR